MKPLAILSVIFALLSWPAKANDHHHIMITDVIVPASLTPTASSAVAYFTIMSHGNEEDKLISVSSPSAQNTSLHESVQENDVAKMRELPSIDVIPGRLTKLEQGGQHVMLTGLAAPLKKGDTVVLNLVFAIAGEIKVDAIVGDAVTEHVHGD
jgi:periplasmic copper chaperone A